MNEAEWLADTVDKSLAALCEQGVKFASGVREAAIEAGKGLCPDDAYTAIMETLEEFEMGMETLH